MERPTGWGINHFKLVANDIVKTKDFYCNLMGTEYIHEYDHYNTQQELFAIMVVSAKH